MYHCVSKTPGPTRCSPFVVVNGAARPSAIQTHDVVSKYRGQMGVGNKRQSFDKGALLRGAFSRPSFQPSVNRQASRSVAGPTGKSRQPLWSIRALR